MATAEKGFDAPRDTSRCHPKGRDLWHQLREIREWWLDSKLKLAAGEFYRISRRISAIWADPWLRYGPAIPNDPRLNRLAISVEENTFVLSCSEGMTQLSRKHEWMGPLDQQLAGEAFQLGFSSACGILDPCRKSDGKA
jgi:hypothetical protein